MDPRAKKAKRPRAKKPRVKRSKGQGPRGQGPRGQGPRGQPFTITRFNILPPTFHDRIEYLLNFITPSIIQSHSYITEWATDPFPKAYSFNTSFWNKDIHKQLSAAVAFIQKHRALFKLLLHHWRSKRLRKMNTEDIVSMDPPKNPVSIVDWNLRAIYTFEASTMMRDITARLMNHDGFFDTPQEPRNPLTNISLTQAQVISLWNQLACMKPSNAFTAYRQSRWDMGKFNSEYGTMLELNAFRKTMKMVHHVDYKDRLMDFIQYSYETEGIHCHVQNFKIAIEKFPEMNLLKLWANICTEFYEAPVLYKGNNLSIQVCQTLSMTKTIPLLHRQGELRLRFKN